MPKLKELIEEGDDEMREYKRYNNIKWGDRYNPESQAHHAHAQDAWEAAGILKGSEADGFQTLWVKNDKWSPVTTTPILLGGILRD